MNGPAVSGWGTEWGGGIVSGRAMSGWNCE